MTPNYCKRCGENLTPEQTECPLCGQDSVPVDELRDGWMTSAPFKTATKCPGTGIPSPRQLDERLWELHGKCAEGVISDSEREELDGRIRAMPSAPATHEPSHVSLSRPFGRPSHIAVTNTRLISTRVHKAPTPRGHRQWIGERR